MSYKRDMFLFNKHNSFLILLCFMILSPAIASSAFNDDFDDYDMGGWSLVESWSAGTQKAVAVPVSNDFHIAYTDVGFVPAYWELYMNVSSLPSTSYYEFAFQNFSYTNFLAIRITSTGINFMRNETPLGGVPGIINNVVIRVEYIAPSYSMKVYNGSNNTQLLGSIDIETTVPSSSKIRMIAYAAGGGHTISPEFDDIIVDTVAPPDVRANIIADPSTVTLNEHVHINWTIIGSDIGDYSYRLEIYDPYGDHDEYDISGDYSGSYAYNTFGLSEGVHTAYVVAYGSGNDMYLAIDTFYIDSSISMYGYTKNARSGAVIPSVNVSVIQGVDTFTDTSDGGGFYTITNISVGSSLTVNATKTGWYHVDYTYIPTFAYNFSNDIYLFNTSYHTGDTGIEGMTLRSPFGNSLQGVVVTISNDTWSNTTSSDINGYYSMVLPNVSETYNVSVSMSGYSLPDNQTIVVTANEWSFSNFVLTPMHQVTIRAKNSVTNGYLSTFSVSGLGNSTVTTTGTASFDVEEGLYLITVSVESGYYAGSEYYLITSDRNIDVSLVPLSTPSTVSNINVDSSEHDVQFILTNISGYRFSNVTVTGNDSSGRNFSGITGDGGSAVFRMNGTQKVNLRFVGPGIDINWTEYPIGYIYHIYLVGNGTRFETINITNTTLTNYTILYTNRSWSMQNLTSGYLNSTLGIGPMGQGVLIGLMSWVLMSAGGIVTVLLAMAVVSLLGLISWVFTLFIAMTVIALFVLLGGIGQSW